MTGEGIMRSAGSGGDWGKMVETCIRDFIDGSPENSLRNRENEKAWTDFLLGFSRGDDPLYEEFKDHIGPFYWTPLEIFNITFPDIEITPDQLTVISWILPQTEKTRFDNRKETRYPSERWARVYAFGEAFNRHLRQHVVDTIQGWGYEAVAPMLSPLWKQMSSERYGLASTWSERHAAHASGLGTFSLSDGLITPKGKAMRCGSAVARIKIEPTPRPYSDHHAYCLFFSKGICDKCISRCPAGAITERGHDKGKCDRYISGITAKYVQSHFGITALPCGLCQTDIPCESKIPTANDLQ
jgi:epoxyqueuosine reductase QueG